MVQPLAQFGTVFPSAIPKKFTVEETSTREKNSVAVSL